MFKQSQSDKNVNKNKNNINTNSDQDKSVCNWLRDTVELPQYYDSFIENGFDKMKVIKYMTKQDLKEIGIEKLGHQKLILACIDDIVNLQ